MTCTQNRITPAKGSPSVVIFMRHRVDASMRHRVDASMRHRVDASMLHRDDASIRHRVDASLGLMLLESA